MTRYVEAFSWTESIAAFLTEVVTERPLLNVCAGRNGWGDVMLDRYEVPLGLQAEIFEVPTVRSDWMVLPFPADRFGAVFADPPWDAEYKAQVAAFMREALRVAPVAYLMAPWTYGAAWARLDRVWVRQIPGVNRTVSLTRYVRSGGAALGPTP